MVIIEQAEGLVVEVIGDEDDYFFVDYSECKENEEYVRTSMRELLEKWDLFPEDQARRILGILATYLQ